MVAIKDMEMPKSCENCDYFKGENTYCARGCFIPFNSPCDEKRPPNCPLVEIEERKVGKWIYDKTSQNWRCSECNETPKTLGYVGTSTFMKEHFKFCNHCGAEMKGTEDE